MQKPTTQHPIDPGFDLRDMLRQHLIDRSLERMAFSEQRRAEALVSGDLDAYREAIREIVRGFYGEFPAGTVDARAVSTYEKEGYRIENVLFESFPGWEVNASVYVPADYAPPFPVVIVPTGHSGKQMINYQLPCQFFARAGYLTISFDPPGQASEKQPGNDHFRDGVRCYTVGQTSSRYFIGDALRCIDYAETRPDADTSGGVAMTGVSGGGTTTIFAVHVDDRIRVIGPSCCVAHRAYLDIKRQYAGCPETYQWRRYAEGLDTVDLTCAAVPVPQMQMAGTGDDLFFIEHVRETAKAAAAFYEAAGIPERYVFFEEDVPHAYSVNMARAFTAFMNRWLVGDPDRPLPDLPDNALTMNPYEELRCYPRQDVNMRTIAAARAREIREERRERPDPAAIIEGAREIVGMESAPEPPPAEVGEPFIMFSHVWRSVLLKPEDRIGLPATYLAGRDAPPYAVLHLDPGGRDEKLASGGPLTHVIGLHNPDPGERLNALAVDLRGWGDSAPALYPYDMVGWGAPDRIISYMCAALGDPLLSQRTRDALAALAWLRAQGMERIVIAGFGLAGWIALHAAAIDGNVSGVVTANMPASLYDLVDAERYDWPADAFWPEMLKHYDIPELAGALACPVQIFHPLGAQKQPPAAHDPDMDAAIRELAFESEPKGK